MRWRLLDDAAIFELIVGFALGVGNRMGVIIAATTEPTNRIGSLFYVPLALLLILLNSLQGLGQKVKP